VFDSLKAEGSCAWLEPINFSDCSHFRRALFVSTKSKRNSQISNKNNTFLKSYVWFLMTSLPKILGFWFLINWDLICTSLWKNMSPDRWNR
jgi:hypothetical protein